MHNKLSRRWGPGFRAVAAGLAVAGGALRWRSNRRNDLGLTESVVRCTFSSPRNTHDWDGRDQ